MCDNGLNIYKNKRNNSGFQSKKASKRFGQNAFGTKPSASSINPSLAPMGSGPRGVRSRKPQKPRALGILKHLEAKAVRVQTGVPGLHMAPKP